MGRYCSTDVSSLKNKARAMAVFGVALAVCAIAMAPLALTQSVTLCSSYPVSNNYSFVELKCLDSIYQTPEHGASFQRNGTTVVEDAGDRTTFITLTQETEVYFTCSLAGSVSNKIGLAGKWYLYSKKRGCSIANKISPAAYYDVLDIKIKMLLILQLSPPATPISA